MKRFAVAMAGSLLASLCLWAGAASSQVGDTTTTTDPTTTTTAVTETTTTAAPVDTTTTVAPAETTTTTTAVPSDTAPTTTIDLSTINLPGRAVSAGSLALDIGFKEHPESNCSANLDLAASQMNVAANADGNLGASYGVVSTNSTDGKAGVLLGALPAAIAVVSITGPCDFDSIGIGNYDSGPGYAKFDGVGVGARPGFLTKGDYIDKMKIDETIGASAEPASLDLNFAHDFLLRQRQ